jgi:hypothetical protein
VSAVERHTFKRRHYRCRACGEYREQLAWDYDTFDCCGQPMVETCKSTFGKAPFVIGDEIDEIIEHAICHPDGSPKRYTSRQEKKRALAEAGYTILGDTPKVSSNRWI